MVGNIHRNIIVTSKSAIEYIVDINHVWVIVEVKSNVWIPLETTGGFIVDPQKSNFHLYFNGIYFDNPKRFKEFNELRNSLFKTCPQASKQIDLFNKIYANTPVTEQSAMASGKVEQKREDCAALIAKVFSYLSNTVDMD